jgi:5-methyltetrahydrofolate--homocysteine methyltransferase
MSANSFQQELARKILILDGAMGTMLQQKGLRAEDFGGSEQEGCNEILNVTRPELIGAIHEAYLAAGADIIETNSFGATTVVLQEYNLENRDIELNLAAARLARSAAEKWATPGKPRFVAGSMGPTTKMLALTGGITFNELEEAYYRQAKGLLAGGIDLFLIETCQDTLNVKAAGCGIFRACQELGQEIPLMVSCTIDRSGTMLAGQNIEAFYVSIQHLNPVAVGLNCGVGADLMHNQLRTLDNLALCAISCYPNAGLPDEEGIYRETPEEFVYKIKKFAEYGWLNIAGGCCGTTDRHIRALAEALAGMKPRTKKVAAQSCVSGIETVWPEAENRPLLVGERTNVIGSRKFKDLIVEARFKEGSEIARAQVKKGAQIVDVCLATPDRDELKDMLDFLPHVVSKVKAPLMLDSTDHTVIEAGLKLIQGKAIINSVNLENGLERLENIVPLVKKYGAALVVGVIDEEGMALTRERKLKVAERSYDLLVRHYGLKPEDIIFDPLTFPVGTGDTKYLGAAVETIEGLRLIKQKMPECKTILGISNVSFGLPAAGREVLNAVFVYMNTLAGLDYAIVNAEKLERYPSIPAAEKKLAEDLLLHTSDRTLQAFTNYFREKKVSEKKQLLHVSLEERLTGYIIEGSQGGLEADLLAALQKYTPLEIINGPLMKGMGEVGNLFNQNQLIVAEVLQSAEVMKAAVSFLEPYMSKQDQAVKGKIVLATVKGDVHDIGKNLVEIILANNGYEVVNLGVKVSSEQLIEACTKEKPDVIGLSGLLVKSVQQMLLTAQDLCAAGIDIPLILGGAALSRKFTEEKIAPAYAGKVLYAKDAMDSLTLLRDLPAPKKAVTVENGDDGIKLSGPAAAKKKAVPEETALAETANAGGSDTIDWDIPLYTPEQTARQLLVDYPLAELTPYINIPRLLKRYLGVKKEIPGHEDKLEDFGKVVQDFLGEIQAQKLITANGLYRLFPAYSQGNSIFVLDPDNTEKISAKFVFPRQQRANGRCLADFIRPQEDGKTDYLGMLALTTGLGISARSAAFKGKGEYLKAYLLQVLALELAEAFAEHLHGIIRGVWGIQDQGIRVSPGYPICPAIEQQRKIFHLLKPEDVGIDLTENWMMDPEASISALVFSHPQARIFSMH